MKHEIKEMQRLLRGLPAKHLVLVPSTPSSGTTSVASVRTEGGGIVGVAHTLGMAEFMVYGPAIIQNILDKLEEQEVLKGVAAACVPAGTMVMVNGGLCRVEDLGGTGEKYVATDAENVHPEKQA